MSNIPPHYINNPHFEQPRISTSLYPSPYPLTQENLPAYSPYPVGMPPTHLPHPGTMPSMPQIPHYGTVPSSASIPSPYIQNVEALKTKSGIVQCIHCGNFVSTIIDYDMGLLTYLSMIGLYMAGCSSGGCLIPYLFPWTKNVVHSCPVCKGKLATFTRLERDTLVHTDYNNSRHQ